MSSRPKILCLAGSLRKDSLNKKLVKAAMATAQEAGADCTFIDLKDYPMPIYDGDIEAESGIPENGKKLKKLLKEHQALLIASPEYNSSISAALKNFIDWTSRPEPGEKSLECYTGKVAGIMACSPGALGGLRGLVTLRSILGNINVIVVPEQIAVSQANEAFTEDGKLKEEKHQKAVANVGKRVAGLTKSILESELVAKS
ncbi:MAG: NAD(P)H-dependent oxidoreductase [Candidatus Obscuribacterales bacterium]|nr:NAD(P)H-dependent oxidoreductase [Candidatus Obscuribacterales bacterium]